MIKFGWCGFCGMSGVELTLGSRNEVAAGVCTLNCPMHETGKTVLLYLRLLIKYQIVAAVLLP